MFHPSFPLISCNLPPGGKQLITASAGCGEKFWCIFHQVAPYGTLHTNARWVLESLFQVPGIWYRAGGGKVSLRTRHSIELDPLILYQNKNKARARCGNSQYSLTLRRGHQQRALFYIIHMKNTIFTYILFIGFVLKQWDVLVGFWQGYLTQRKLDEREREGERENHYFHLCYWSILKKRS